MHSTSIKHASVPLRNRPNYTAVVPSSCNMATTNEHNVYFGPDALKKYFDPDCQPPLPLVELPQHLNPFHHDGVRIYAKMMTMHPANNVKALPGTRALAVMHVVSH